MSRPRFVAFLVLTALFLASAAPAADDAPLEDALRATFRITQGKTSGTCFLVALEEPVQPKKRRHALITAAHVFDEMKGQEGTVVFRAEGPDGDYTRKEISVSLREGTKPIWTRHPQADIAAMFLELPDSVDAKPIELRQLADEKRFADRKVRVGQDVWIPCFPAQLEGNAVGWPILRRGSIATHPLTPIAASKTLFVDYSHFAGDSGAPLLASDGKELMLVGLVFAMQRQTDETVSPFEKRTVHTPLDLAIAVPSPFVRETVELLLRK